MTDWPLLGRSFHPIVFSFTHPTMSINGEMSDKSEIVEGWKSNIFDLELQKRDGLYAFRRSKSRSCFTGSNISYWDYTSQD